MNGNALDPIIAALPPELRRLLDAELSSGNRIVECGLGLYGGDAKLVLLAKPFRPITELPPGVVLREINDPHWWKAEYVHEQSKHCLACRF